MESSNKNQKPEDAKKAKGPSAHGDNEETKFENPSVDPGFETIDEEEAAEAEELTKEQQEDTSKENDALNYKNDREHGTFNPKNI